MVAASLQRARNRAEWGGHAPSTTAGSNARQDEIGLRSVYFHAAGLYVDGQRGVKHLQLTSCNAGKNAPCQHLVTTVYLDRVRDIVDARTP